MRRPVVLQTWRSVLLLAGIATYLASGSLQAQTTGTSGGATGTGGFGGGQTGGTGGGLTGASNLGGSTGGGLGFGGTSGGLGFSGTSGTGNLGFSGTSGSLGFSGTAGTQGFGGGFGGRGVGGGATGIPQASNPFRTYYANPYAMGYPGSTGTTGSTAFGQPVGGTRSSTGTGIAGSGVLGGGALGRSPGGLVSASTIGIRRAPVFMTTLGFKHKAPSDGKLQSSLADVFKESTSFKAKDKIHIRVQGRTAILQGIVTSTRERRLAEALVRLTPGVSQVKNQLEVQTSTTSLEDADE